MNWGEIVGPLIQSAAPTIGSILGGLIPLPGGSIIGEEIGKIVANQFGVPATPEAVNQAVQNSPSDIAATKLAAAEAEVAAKWPALAAIAQADAADRTAQSQAINTTIQAEVAKGQPWYAWRNLWSYSVTAECAGVGAIFMTQLATGDAKALNLFSQFTGFLMSWYGMRVGVLGYIFRGASNEKIAAVTGESPSVVKSVIKAVTGKK